MEIKTANKCYITDTQGNIYIDTTMGSGAQIIGHNNPLIRKIGQQIKRGTIYTIPNCHTNKVNSYLKKHISVQLYNKIKPIAKKAIYQVEVTKYWNPLLKSYNTIPFTKIINTIFYL